MSACVCDHISELFHQLRDLYKTQVCIHCVWRVKLVSVCAPRICIYARKYICTCINAYVYLKYASLRHSEGLWIFKLWTVESCVAPNTLNFRPVSGVRICLCMYVYNVCLYACMYVYTSKHIVNILGPWESVAPHALNLRACCHCTCFPNLSSTESSIVQFLVWFHAMRNRHRDWSRKETCGECDPSICDTLCGQVSCVSLFFRFSEIINKNGCNIQRKTMHT